LKIIIPLLKIKKMKTDLEIQRDVIDELKWEPLLNAAEVGVSVKNGIVTLSGTVDRYLKKTAAEKAAQRVAGVKAVAEDIVVKLAADFKKTDAEIATAVLDALKWHSAIQEHRLKVKVEDGIVTLEGEVDWEFQKNSAKLMAENLAGVKGIVNKIKIVPVASAKDVRQKLNAAFHRNAALDADRIKIETIGSKVILTGKVRTWAERKDAERAAWYTPGISEVENKIEIDTEIYAL
jgi:osmotically-inducible protein OsmY